MVISTANEDEMAIIKDELAHFGVDPSLLGGKHVYSKRGNYVEMFLASEDIAASIGEFDAEPIYFGLKLGEVVKGRFRASLEFGTAIFRSASRNVVVLDGKQGQLFLYGRDIFRENLEKDISLGRKMVGDKDGNLLGYGIYDGRNLVNVIDKGAYLRQYK